MSSNSTSWSTIQDFLEDSDSQTIDCFHRTQWNELCRVASSFAGNLECRAIDQITSGLNNIVRLLRFSDQTLWVARIHIRRNTSPTTSSTSLETEVATMQLIEEQSDIPVPRVFAYEADENNPVKAAFILMELLPGIVAMDALGGYKVHRGVIPKDHRENFYRSVAKCHVKLTSIRFPKIGTIIRNHDGTYESGPLPGIGGPFNTAAAFFEAWANTVKFKLDNETITRMMVGFPTSSEHMISIIKNFPLQIKAMASKLSLYNEGPFPLNHDDFLHSNIMVDEGNFDVTGIIDWEGACTVPWELIAFPDFLETMPASFGLPKNYDQDGQPLNEQVRTTWREREAYVEMVKLLEGQDDLLSACLGSKRSQAIAYSYGAYTSIGKLGAYDRVMEELQGISESKE